MKYAEEHLHASVPASVDPAIFGNWPQAITGHRLYDGLTSRIATRFANNKRVVELLSYIRGCIYDYDSSLNISNFNMAYVKNTTTGATAGLSVILYSALQNRPHPLHAVLLV